MNILTRFDADIPPNLQDVVFVPELSCDEPIERLCYAVNLPTYAFNVPHLYPQCDVCAEKVPIETEKFKKRKNKI